MSGESLPTLPLLESLQIATPCTADWEKMEGNDRQRFCSLCQLNVYNFAGMTREEAETLVRTNEGKLCARIYRRTDGTVITQDCPVGIANLRQKMIRTAVSIAAVAASILGGMVAWGMTASGFRASGRSILSDWKSQPTVPLGALVPPISGKVVMGGCPAPPGPVPPVSQPLPQQPMPESFSIEEEASDPQGE